MDPHVFPKRIFISPRKVIVRKRFPKRDLQKMDERILLLTLSLALVSFGHAASLPTMANNTNATKNGTGRTLYGLLGFLTGFRLGQGIGPSSYSADIRESAQLNLFAKLFNGALYVAYAKYPYQLTNINQNPTLYPPFPPNVFPSNLQPPIWYPQTLNPPVISSGPNPVNQQQIINIHEPFNPETAPNENYQESSVHNTQEIQNNFVAPSDPGLGIIEGLDKVSIETDEQNDTTSKHGQDLLCIEDCIEAIKDEIEDLQESTITNIKIKPVLLAKINDDSEPNTTQNTSIPIEKLENRVDTPPSTTESQVSTTTNQPVSSTVPSENATPSKTSTAQSISSNQTTESASPAPTSTPESASTTPSQTTESWLSTTITYPYPYYHGYENASKYEQISITENPNFLLSQPPEQIYYEEPNSLLYQSLPKFESVPFVTSPGNYFKPMDIFKNAVKYHDIGTSYRSPYYKYNKRLEDSDFVPVLNANRYYQY